MAISILVHLNSDDNRIFNIQTFNIGHSLFRLIFLHRRDPLRPLSQYTRLTVGLGPNAPSPPLPSTISCRSRIIPALEDQYGHP
jgi:hypothetical protein